jgi:hypothetical protein
VQTNKLLQKIEVRMKEKFLEKKKEIYGIENEKEYIDFMQKRFSIGLRRFDTQIDI